jgi:hypothetical protein
VVEEGSWAMARIDPAEPRRGDREGALCILHAGCGAVLHQARTGFPASE